jgi:hypothetical protein
MIAALNGAQIVLQGTMAVHRASAELQATAMGLLQNLAASPENEVCPSRRVCLRRVVVSPLVVVVCGHQPQNERSRAHREDWIDGRSKGRARACVCVCVRARAVLRAGAGRAAGGGAIDHAGDAALRRRGGGAEERLWGTAQPRLPRD